MWNSPIGFTGTPGCFDRQFAPRSIHGLIYELENALYVDPADREHPFPHFMFDAGVLAEVPEQIVLWEAIKVIEQMVDRVPHTVAPHALAECIVANLAQTLLRNGRIYERIAGEKDGTPDRAWRTEMFEPYYLVPVNALRRLAGEMKPLKSLDGLSDEAWSGEGGIVQRTLLWNSYWQIALEPNVGDFINNRDGVLDDLLIDARYLSPFLRPPREAEWTEALRRFRVIADWAKESPEIIPADAFFRSARD